LSIANQDLVEPMGVRNKDINDAIAVEVARRGVIRLASSRQQRRCEATLPIGNQDLVVDARPTNEDIVDAVAVEVARRGAH
jgi:hypothetical protein